MGITSVNIPQQSNMKSMILLAVFLAVAAAAPQETKVILIKSQTQNHDTEKQEYSFSYETENGISVSESGVQKQIGDKPEDSVTYTVTWVADENGFQAKGDHLPTPPPMPEHVVKLLNDLRAAGQL